MFNRLTTLVLFLAIMAAPIVARAQGKIGVINMAAALGSTQEGKKAMADLQKKYLPRQQELQRLQGEIQGLQDRLSKGQGVMSDDEARRLGRELEDKQKLYKRSTDDAQSDYAADRDDSIRRIEAKMVKVIDEYAQQNGYVLIIDDAQIPVYYASKEIDLLPEMVKRYDAENPVAEATPAPKPATHTAAPVPRPKNP